MPKRKRSSPAPTESVPARQKKICAERLASAQKPLLAALRHGATLERQKHSRRKKVATSKKDDKGLERINAEYAVLKALNIEQLADQHLRKTLARVKSLKDAEPLQEYIGGIREGSKDTVTLNVTARLFKVPTVKKVVDAVIEDLKSILGGGDAKKQMQGDKKEDTKKAKKVEVREEDEEMRDVSNEEDDPYMAFSARIAAPSSGEEDSAASVSGDERPPSIGDSDSEHDPDDDLEAEDADSEEEAAFNGFSDDEEAPSGKAHLSRSIAPPSDDASDSDSDSDEAAIPTAKTKTKAQPIDTKSGSSAFIPALSHAAYFSGSESSASDLDADIAPRKNRRGQRARQKIAEAKFGAKAKHLERVQRNAGWDAKRGAVADDNRAARRGKPMGRGPQQSGGNAEPLGDRGEKVAKKNPGVRRDDKGELHPSWQAAKMAKESKKLKIDVKGGGAAGKKVVFD
jgi:hypothetical protein